MKFLEFPNEVILAISSCMDHAAHVWKLAQGNHRLFQLLKLDMYRCDSQRGNGESKALRWAVFGEKLKFEQKNSIAVNAIKAGANVNMKIKAAPTNPNGLRHADFSLLAVSVFFNEPLLTMMLLHSGADVNAGRDDGTSPLIMAVRSGSRLMIGMIMERPETDRNARFRGGGGVLTAAVLSRNIPMLKLLLDSGFDPNEYAVGPGRPLYTAVEAQDYDMVALLLNSETIEPNLPVELEYSWVLPKAKTAFARACGAKSLEIIKLLHDSDKVNVDPVCVNDVTPARSAYFYEQRGNMDFLLKSSKCKHANDVLFELACGDQGGEEFAKKIVELTPLRGNAHRATWMRIAQNHELDYLSTWISRKWPKA